MCDNALLRAKDLVTCCSSDNGVRVRELVPLRSALHEVCLGDSSDPDLRAPLRKLSIGLDLGIPIGHTLASTPRIERWYFAQ